MTGMEAIATAHALVDADRYGRLRVTAQCVSYESAILALLWRLAELEGQVAA